MKKGCFLSVIITLTIVLIVVFYLVRYYGEDLLEVGKEQLVEFVQSDITTKIGNLEDNEYSDSLNILVKQYFKDLDLLDIESELSRIEEFSDDIEVVLMDSKIDSAEFNFITNLLTKYE